MKNYIGIDNGVSGSIGILTGDESYFFKIPTKSEQSYTKTKKNITRISVIEFTTLLKNLDVLENTCVVIERPMVNPGRFTATLSAMRALEATIIVLEQLQLPYLYLDSKEWQKSLLPSGIKGSPELKKASLDIGKRLFPHLGEEIQKQKDADGLLIAEYARRTNL
jgi:hypothetical protein